MSLLPVRCFTCGYTIGKYESKYEELLEQGLSEQEAVETFNLKRYCCKRMFYGYVNIIDKLLLFSEIPKKEKK
jgi:DNA-directed RNA polymerase I, II, and III subunit RPABC5